MRDPHRETTDGQYKVSEGSSSRFSSHSLLVESPTPGKNAQRTKRVTPCYQRDRQAPTNWARAITI
jgi:hypothetical protein